MRTNRSECQVGMIVFTAVEAMFVGCGCIGVCGFDARREGEFGLGVGRGCVLAAAAFSCCPKSEMSRVLLVDGCHDCHH